MDAYFTRDVPLEIWQDFHSTLLMTWGCHRICIAPVISPRERIQHFCVYLFSCDYVILLDMVPVHLIRQRYPSIVTKYLKSFQTFWFYLQVRYPYYCQNILRHVIWGVRSLTKSSCFRVKYFQFSVITGTIHLLAIPISDEKKRYFF